MSCVEIVVRLCSLVLVFFEFFWYFFGVCVFGCGVLLLVGLGFMCFSCYGLVGLCFFWLLFACLFGSELLWVVGL